MNDKKTRVTLDLSPQFYQRLEELESLVDAQSKAEVIRNALQLYEYMAQKSKDGWTFCETSPSGDEKGIVFLGAVSLTLRIIDEHGNPRGEFAPSINEINS